MRIAGLQKLTLLDFPGRTAATVFTVGCNLRCPFCHNAEIAVPAEAAVPEEDPTAVLAFLKKRQGLLDGVCISGGEPLLQPDLADFCRSVRALGYAVKLDTNGTLPDRLRALLREGLLDCVAMDVKNAPARYAEAAGVPTPNLDAIRESMRLLLERAPSFEFRTTVARELHTADDLLGIAGWLADEARQAGAPDPAWFVQNFKDSDTVLAGIGALHPWGADDLRALLPQLQEALPTAQLRGVD